MLAAVFFAAATLALEAAVISATSRYDLISRMFLITWVASKDCTAGTADANMFAASLQSWPSLPAEKPSLLQALERAEPVDAKYGAALSVACLRLFSRAGN